MKIVKYYRAILLAFFCRNLLASSELDCSVEPDLNSTRRCCMLPPRTVSQAEGMCSLRNSPAKEELEKCFKKQFDSYQKNKPNMSIGAILLQPYFLPFHPVPNGHISHFEKIVETCPTELTENLNDDLAKFYDCSLDVLAANCSSFIQIDGCYEVEDKMLKCDKFPVNCQQFPEHIQENSCCQDTPELFKVDLQDSCLESCSSKEYFKVLLQKCFYDCIVNATNVVNDCDEFDFEMAEKVLKENVNSSDASVWEKPIDTAVEKCQEMWTGLKIP